MLYSFADCELDASLYELRRGGTPCHVEPQVFDVLAYLLAHRDRVVAKEELLEEVWGDGFVTEAALNSRIMAARKAIGDDGHAQHLIKTLRGRGFRFVGEVEERDGATPPVPHRSSSEETSLVPFPNQSAEQEGTRTFGREEELRHLRARLEAARAGKRQLIFVTGEAGLGKTTLVNTFLAEAGHDGDFWLLQGYCLEQHGAGEPYMPLLAALARLCRGPSGEDVTALLAQCAPTWLVQMPQLVSAEDMETLQRRVVGTTRERMLREMVETLEVLAERKPLMLVLEDLHWCDYSTLDLLSWLARRPEPARLMAIGTYRPADVMSPRHPLRTLAQELRIRGRCVELALSFLDETAMTEYLARRLATTALPDGLARLVHQRTDGNPLFIRLLVGYWLDRQWLAKVDGRWVLHATPEELVAEMPDDLRQLIERQIEQLAADEQQTLEAASVVGMEFSAAAATTGVEEEAEAHCEALARRDCFVLPCGTKEWPDGTLSARYGFIHHLHREVLYDRIAAGRRARLHRRIGERLEAGYGPRAHEIAVELATHFVRGRDAARAVRYLKYAGEQALQRSAQREAIEHLTTALQVLQNQPETRERMQCELSLQMMLAPALIATRGWAAPEAEQAYLRARELSEQLEATAELATVLYGLAALYEFRGEYEPSQVLLEQRLELLNAGRRNQRGDAEQDGEAFLESHELLSCSLFHQGAFVLACEHADEGLKFYDPERHNAFLAPLGVDAGVGCHGWASLALWFAGYPDQALARVRRALDLAQSPDHAYSLVTAMSQAATLHQLRRETTSVRNYAEAMVVLATEKGFPYYVATGTMLDGWALAMQGQHAAGIGQLQRGLAACHATGATLDYPYFLALLAEAYGTTGQVEEGLKTVAEALHMVQKSRTYFYEAELRRLMGNLLRSCGQEDEAEICFEQALQLARQQRAKSLELRAAISLRHLRQQSQPEEDAKAHQLLAGVYGSFTEGFDTPDMKQAGALLLLNTQNMTSDNVARQQNFSEGRFNTCTLYLQALP